MAEVNGGHVEDNDVNGGGGGVRKFGLLRVTLK
jgi:hypothetical protein